MNVLSQAHIVQVIVNSIVLSIAVGIGCTFFGLVLAIIFLFDWLIGEARISRSKAKNQA